MKTENTYIMNLEGCYIYKDILENKKITYKKRDLIKLFSATIPYSLETIRIEKYFPNTFYEINEKQYTRKIINITFDKNLTLWDENKEWEDKDGNIKKGKRITVANKNKIRKYLYNNGFIMDGIKYVFYKRGAGKAKNGYALYIQKSMKDMLIKRSRLGLKFKKDEEVDLTSLLAYESLISSGVEYTIKLDPKTEILLIDDIYGKKFKSLASVTREKNNEIKTENETIEIQNCLTDGQGLLDESVFKKYNKENKGMMLLRSDMFKDCGFNTKLQEWFKENEIKKIKDMFNNEYDATKIKLITTPNSLKFLKFAYKFTKTQTIEEYNNLSQEKQSDIKKKCYEYWKDNIDDTFGVVKCDKEGNYGNYNRLTYQLLNSIPNLTHNELMEITKKEREYVMLLKNDEAVFRNYLGCDAKASLKLEKDIEKGDITLYENTDLMNALLLVNSDIQYTTKFKKMKSDLISNYISHLKEGKIRIKDAKYVTIVSNPYEMLLATMGEYKENSIMKGREVYCKYYNNNQEFCVSRNPHINAGNVMYAKNKYHKEYKWFNFTDNIMVVNFYDNDMPDRLQGEDTDSDVNLIIPNKILIEKAKYCEENFPTPINKVKGKSKPKKYNMKELQKLDIVLSNNYIGKIVNMSQIINSYMNNAIFEKMPKEIINELYQASSKLSSMSQIEIDKSKKVFDNINMGKELSKIKNIKSIRYIEENDKYGQLAKKMIVPKFFNIVSDSNEYRVFDRFNTPLDILQDVLMFKGGKRLSGKKNIKFKDLLIQSKDLEGIYQINSANAILKIVLKCGKKINGLNLKTCTLNNKAKQTVKRKAKMEAVEKIKKLLPSEATILSILKQCFDEKEDKLGFKKYGMLTLNLLFMSKKIQVLKCFKKSNMNLDEVLVKIEGKYEFNIFGDKYQKVKRKDLNI
ncbi:hypothetical protein [Clostridium botulinum]|uniref:hypothetical protein n=1 Tax=Clostridium botulinum TaxID=1491 RepID=UPI0007744CA8|nr:hypothetical protein [Clostridium botulinum]